MKLFIFSTLCALFQFSYAFAPLQVITGKDPFNSNMIKVRLPGYFAVVLTDASGLSCNIDYMGLASVYDLKNDSAEQHDMANLCQGMNAEQSAFASCKNYIEVCVSPGTVSVLESNNVRAVLQYKYSPRPYGNQCYTPIDSNLVIEHTYTIYRPDKMYNTLRLHVRNQPDTCGGMSANLSISWVRFSGEPYYMSGWGGSIPYTPTTPSPWTFVYEGNDYRGPDYLGNHYILYTATPGFTVHKTTGDTVRVKANFMYLLKDEKGFYVHQGQPFVGLRSEIPFWNNKVLQPNTTYTMYGLNLQGDNNITCRDSANTYIAEYCSSATPVMSKGTTTGFNAEYGCYDFTSANDSASFTLTGMLHYPAFSIRSWNKGVPATIKVNSVALVRDSDYIGTTDSGRLLIQVMKVYKGNPTTQFDIFGDNTPTAIKPAQQNGYAPGLSIARPFFAGGALTVRYQIQEYGNTSLRVYDLSGKLIRTIVGTQHAVSLQPGIHETQWTEPAGIRSGIYLFVLEQGDKKVSRMLPVIK